MTISSSILLTDLYELTMIQVWDRQGIKEQGACFDLFFRKNPFSGGYVVAVGISEALNFLKAARFTDEDIRYLSDLGLFDLEFLDWLKRFRFKGSIYAAPEGSIVFPNEPVVRVVGSIAQCQLIETILLNIINFQSLIATKASRICRVAGWDKVLEFGARRAQGPDGALSASRAAYIGGCIATSNLEAGKEYGIPVSGTMAHSFVMASSYEGEAFRRYCEVYPEKSVLLVDTYNVGDSGMVHAIEVGREMATRGEQLTGIRIDSGDIAALAFLARKRLDNAGLFDTRIVVSSDLDEYRISSLKEAGAPIDLYGVGTRLVTGWGEPALSGVYKLAAVKNDGIWEKRMKTTEEQGKATLPGVKQVFRTYGADGMMLGDIIEAFCDTIEGSDVRGYEIGSWKEKWISNVNRIEPLLTEMMVGGEIVYNIPALPDIRALVIQEMEYVPSGVLKLREPEKYEVLVGDKLRGMLE